MQRRRACYINEAHALKSFMATMQLEYDVPIKMVLDRFASKKEGNQYQVALQVEV